MIGKHPLIVVVGSGGVGKTTLAASLGLESAAQGNKTLVMTFDPSLRLKDALQVGDDARHRAVTVPLDLPRGGPGQLDASLLDASQTFDRLIEKYAPDEQARQRILDNRFYQHLSGSLAGILEYMAVERLFEVSEEGAYDQIILDTPPTRQALDFLEAPERILSFLKSPALPLAQREWFDANGKLKATSGLGLFARGVEKFLDRVIGVDFLREVSEFFLSFGPLYEGFEERAREVSKLLGSPSTRFMLVSGPGQERIPDALFFARKLREAGHHLDAVVINRIHPDLGGVPGGQSPETPDPEDGRALMKWLGERDRKGVEELTALLGEYPLVQVPMLGEEPTDLPSLQALGARLATELPA